MAPSNLHLGGSEDVVDPVGLRHKAARRRADEGDEGEAAALEVVYADTVDEDEEEALEKYISEDLVGRLIESMSFRLFILGVIVLNSVLIGLQTYDELNRRTFGLMSSIDSIFLTIFVVEIVLKWYNGFWIFWKVGWNVFDFFVVFVSLLGQVSFVSSGRVLRIFRVLRAFRTLRSISALQGLQVIVQTILQSLPDMANILLLLSIIMFIFAVIGVNVFGEALPEYFGNMVVNFYTLFIMVTQDGWVQIFTALQDQGLFFPAAIYFSVFITIGAFIFANIIVGIIVNNLEYAYAEMKKFKKQKHRQLRKHVHRAYESRKVVGIEDVPPNVWSSQRPLELPNFQKVSPAMVKNYFLVLAAMEENMLEFQKLRQTLEGVLEDVNDVNAVQDDILGDGIGLQGQVIGEEMDESDSESVTEIVKSKDDLDGGGDALSRMIRLERLGGKNHGTVSSALRAGHVNMH